MRSRPLRAGALALALLALGAATPFQVAATPTVIYRCTAPDGAVTFQNDTPCAAGLQQQRRVIDIAAPLPAFVAPAPPVERPPAVPMISTLPAAAPGLRTGPDAQRAAPPALFACRVFDGSTYWREDAAAPPRCRPLATVGIGGLPGMGAGQACEMHEDVCEAVPEAGLCGAWENRVREAEFRWRFGESGARDAARIEYERLFTALQASTCAHPAE
ncbi:hypothetical protein [Luteimonas deserti]|uniref:DUF4124 domain-containing protein n=1 Tax=Luteimonas deserti TaxID=2752306 RepID=A0A7Z0QRA2_9GAMM|nr:hypothetical protein [Luteimonas deserti]NYZ62325.1 hypothetical protein [Luteimonas deserti]